ncbi:MAG: PQQ-binding-like beta-propeller repeat protein, partial [Nanoarchaeota archaeon]
MNRFFAVLFLLLALPLASSCGSGSGSVAPTVPSFVDNSTTDMLAIKREANLTATQLWGFYTVTVDIENQTIEAEPNRTVAETYNVVGLLNHNHQCLILSFNDIDTTTIPGETILDVNASIRHPINNPETDVYDVRGVYIGNGHANLKYDISPDARIPVAGIDQVLVNADGYTRWFNPNEFMNPGLAGYTEGKIACPDNFVGSSTINPYKYFGKGIVETDEDLMSYLTSGEPDVGTFLYYSYLSRNYKIRFPNIPGIVFNYAIIASWNGPKPENHPAHSHEAQCATLDASSSTMYYANSDENGGDLILDIDVFDWFATPNQGVMEDYDIIIESDVLLAPYHLDMEVADNPYPNVYSYHAEIPTDPTKLEGNELWVIIENPDYTYTHSSGIHNDAENDTLAAFFRVFNLPVLDYNPNPSIEIISPNYWYQLQPGAEQEITWTSANVPGNVFIDYSKDDFNTDIHSISPNEPNDGSHIWIVPDDPSSNVRIRISSFDDPNVNDVSNAFTILGPPTPWINLISPNGSEIWEAETIEEIFWESGNITGTVFLEYSKDDFTADIHPISDHEDNDGSFLWDIPVDPSDTVKVRVSSTMDPDAYDESEAYFTIIYEPPPWIAVISPNGGEFLQVITEHSILWNSEYVTGNVLIEYSKDGFISNIITIISDTPNDGSHMWTVPDDVSDTVRIRITSIDSPAVSDTSDDDFSIVPEPLDPWILVTSPNGGETFVTETYEEITWDSNDVAGTVFLEYSNDSFVSDIHTIAAGETNDGSCLWEVPDYPNSTVWVRVSSTDDTAVYDVSDEPFSIEVACIWPMFQHDHQRTGQSFFTGPQTNAIEWTYQTGNTIFCSPAVAEDGTLYFGNYSGNFFALNPDGTEKWPHVNLGGFIGS